MITLKLERLFIGKYHGRAMMSTFQVGRSALKPLGMRIIDPQYTIKKGTVVLDRQTGKRLVILAENKSAVNINERQAIKYLALIEISKSRDLNFGLVRYITKENCIPLLADGPDFKNPHLELHFKGFLDGSFVPRIK